MLPPVLATNKHHKLSSVMALMFQALYDNSIDVGRTTKPTAFLTAGNISLLLFFNTEINKQASDCCCQLV